METLKLENLKINNQGREYADSCYERLHSTIDRINLYIVKKGFIPEGRKNDFEVINYAMNNEVTIEQLHHALVFAKDDLEKAMNSFKK